MSGLCFMVVVLAVALGNILGHSVLFLFYKWPTWLVVLAIVVFSLTVGHYWRVQRLCGQIDHATDKCLLSVAPLTRRV